MSEQLIHVRDKDGNETYVGQAWLDRWPGDFTPVDGDTTNRHQQDRLQVPGGGTNFTN